MKFQNCILINFVTDARTDGQAKSNMPLQLFQSWGHKQCLDLWRLMIDLADSFEGV